MIQVSTFAVILIQFVIELTMFNETSQSKYSLNLNSTMKKLFVILIVFSMGLPTSFSQVLEISGYGGYMLNSNSNYINGEVDVFDAGVFGGPFGYELADGMQVQFLYNRNSTDGRVSAFLTGTSDFDLVIEHFHLGVEKPLGGGENIKPFGAYSLGATSYSASSAELEEQVTRFSMGFGAGVKIFPSEKIGLKFQAKLFMPLLFSGVGVFCSSGSGCGGSSSFYVPIVHAEFSGGVVFRMPQ